MKTPLLAPQPDLDQMSADDLSELVDQGPGLDEAIASHEETPAATLARLSLSANRAVVRAVMLNPGTPKRILLAKASKYPREFLQNPVFVLLLIEEPDLLLRLPVTAVKSMLRDPQCPAAMIGWALTSNSSSFALALAGSATASAETLRAVARSRHVRAVELALSRLMKMGLTLEGHDQ